MNVLTDSLCYIRMYLARHQISELKFKVALLYMMQLLQLLSLMSLQSLYPFCQLGRRALDNYCFIYMYHKPID